MISNASVGNGRPTSSSVTPMRPGSRDHHAAIACARQHAPSGDGVAVDCRNDGLRKEEDCLVETVQTREKVAEVIGTVLKRAQQIDAGGEDASLPCQDDGACFRPFAVR